MCWCVSIYFCALFSCWNDDDDDDDDDVNEQTNLLNERQVEPVFMSSYRHQDEVTRRKMCKIFNSWGKRRTFGPRLMDFLRSSMYVGWLCAHLSHPPWPPLARACGGVCIVHTLQTYVSSTCPSLPSCSASQRLQHGHVAVQRRRQRPIVVGQAGCCVVSSGAIWSHC